MDFLNKAISQVTDLFKSMTPGARMTAGMLLVMIVISLGYLFTMQGSRATTGTCLAAKSLLVKILWPCRRPLPRPTSTTMSLTAVACACPRGALMTTSRRLNKANFEYTGGDVDLSEEQGGGFFQSSEDKKWVRGELKARQFRHAIEKFADISTASVRFTETKEPGSFPPKVRRAATVILSSTDGKPLSRNTLQKIRASAAGWFNIAQEEVAITDQNGSVIPVGGNADGLDEESRPYIMAKAWHDDYYEGRINDMLSFIGPGLIAVVDVELDETLTSESTKVTVDPQTVPFKTNTLTKSQESRPPDGARPGAQPNRVSSDTPRHWPPSISNSRHPRRTWNSRNRSPDTSKSVRSRPDSSPKR